MKVKEIVCESDEILHFKEDVQIEVRCQSLIFEVFGDYDINEVNLMITNSKGVVRDKMSLLINASFHNDEYRVVELSEKKKLYVVELGDDGYIEPTLFLEIEGRFKQKGDYIKIFCMSGNSKMATFFKTVKSVHNSEIEIEEDCKMIFNYNDVDYIQTNTVNDTMEMTAIYELKDNVLRKILDANKMTIVYLLKGTKVGINKQTTIYRQESEIVNNLVEKVQLGEIKLSSKVRNLMVK